MLIAPTRHIPLSRLKLPATFKTFVSEAKFPFQNSRLPDKLKSSDKIRMRLVY